MTSEERFERIETKHEELADLIARSGQAQDKRIRDLTETFAHSGQAQDKRIADVTELVARIGQGHIELEAAQLNQQKMHARLEGIVADIGERLANLTILVDTLIKRDMHG